MLLPALNKARASAMKIDCTNNLKQIGTALAMYAGDQQNFPPADQEKMEDYHLQRWYHRLRPYLGSKEVVTDWKRATETGREGALFCKATEVVYGGDELGHQSDGYTHPSIRTRDNYFGLDGSTSPDLRHGGKNALMFDLHVELVTPQKVAKELYLY